MKRENVNYLLVGSFVLLMGAVLLYGLYRITGNTAKGDVYYTHFPNVAGIKVGTVVTFEGFEVGNVTELVPVLREKRTWYKVTLNIRQPLALPKDSLAMIATPGLLSPPLVEIKEGSSSEVLASGGELAGVATKNVMESVANLSNDLGQLAETSVKPLLAQISKRVETVGDSLEQHVPSVMSDMRATMARLNTTSARVETLFSPENQKNLGSMLKNGNEASASVLKLSQELQVVRSEVEDLIKDSHELVNSNGKDLQLSLRRADAVLYQLESAGRNLNEFSRSIRDNPAALVQGRPPVDVAGEAK